MSANLDVDVAALVAKNSPSGFNEKILACLPSDRGGRFEGDEYNIALYIQRSKNKNVVCYRGTYTDLGTLDPKAPIDAYWLDIDPEYVKANRESGKMDDRCELNLIDRTMAYGHSPSAPREAQGVVYFDVSFVALSSRKMHLVSVPGSKENPSEKTNAHTPVVLCTIGGVPSVATRIYVQATEPKHFWNLPSVEYVELFGTSIETGAPTYEKVTV